MELKELENDLKVREILQKVHASIVELNGKLEIALQIDPTKLTPKERVDFNLFITYALNTLFWIYLKTKGIDPNLFDVKNQLQRVKEYMIKAKMAEERDTLRPRLDVPAAARFVKHGMNHKKSREGQEDR